VTYSKFTSQSVTLLLSSWQM